MKINPGLFRGVVALSFFLTFTASGIAADRFWDASTSQDWNVAANWSADAAGTLAGAVPVAADRVIFSVDSLTTAQTINLLATRTVDGLEFSATSGATTFLSGTGGAVNINIGASGVQVNAGAGAVTFGNGNAVGGVPVRLLTSQTWTNNSTNAVSVLNTMALIDNAAAPSTLTVNGSGPTIYNNTLNNGTGANNVLSVTKSGTGTLTLNGSNNYTGVTTISGGTIAVRALGNGGSNSGLGAATNAASNLIFDGGTLDYIGTANGASDRGFTLSAGGATLNNSTAFTEILTGTVTGSGTLTKTGTGVVALTNAASDYTGKTFVNEGTLSIRRSAALGIGTTAANGTEIAAGATLGIDPNSSGGAGANIAITEIITSNGGTIQNITRNNTLSGAVTMSATSTLQAESGTQLTLSGQLSESAQSGLNKTGAGTVILTNATNNFTGVTTISAGVLQISSIANGGLASSLGSSSNAPSNLVLDGGRLAYTGASIGVDRGLTLGPNGGGIQVSILLRLDGIVTGTGDLTKTGGGTLALTDFNGINNYTGRTIVSAGTLAARSINALGASGTTANGTQVDANATLLLDPNGSNGTGANVTWNEVLTLNGGTLENASRNNLWQGSTTLAANSTVRAAATTTVNLAGAIGESTPAATITKSGAGTVVFSSTSNTYTGATIVTEGVLSVTGNINSSTALQVSTGTLSMGASNIFNDGATVTLGQGALLQTNGFSDALGVLAVTGDATLSLAGGNSVIVFADPATASWSGTLALTGWDGLATGNGPDQVIFNGVLSADQLGRITIHDGTGTYSAVQLASGEVVRGVLVPEPSSVLLAAAGGALILRRRRKSAAGIMVEFSGI